MDCELIGNMLHIKSNVFSSDVVEQIKYRFIDFLHMYFRSYDISCIQQLIDQWDKLKDSFEACFNLFVLTTILLQEDRYDQKK